MSRKYGKPDANHGEIACALASAGCSVLDLKAMGHGCPDLLVAGPVYPHTTLLLEVKDGKKPPSEQKLRPAQVKFHSWWRGPIHVVTSVEEALDVVGIVRIESTETAP